METIGRLHFLGTVESPDPWIPDFNGHLFTALLLSQYIRNFSNLIRLVEVKRIGARLLGFMAVVFYSTLFRAYSLNNYLR